MVPVAAVAVPAVAAGDQLVGLHAAHLAYACAFEDGMILNGPIGLVVALDASVGGGNNASLWLYFEPQQKPQPLVLMAAAVVVAADSIANIHGVAVADDV